MLCSQWRWLQVSISSPKDQSSSWQGLKWVWHGVHCCQVGPNNGNFLNMPLSVLICIKVYSFYLLQWNYLYHYCCCSVTKSCPTLCDPMNCSTQVSLSFAISWSLLKLMSIESVMLSNHLILCCPLLLPPSVFPSIRVFSNDSALHLRWPKY